MEAKAFGMDTQLSYGPVERLSFRLEPHPFVTNPRAVFWIQLNETERVLVSISELKGMHEMQFGRYLLVGTYSVTYECHERAAPDRFQADFSRGPAFNHDESDAQRVVGSRLAEVIERTASYVTMEIMMTRVGSVHQIPAVANSYLYESARIVNKANERSSQEEWRRAEMFNRWANKVSQQRVTQAEQEPAKPKFLDNEGVW